MQEKVNLARDEEQLTDMGKWLPEEKRVELTEKVEAFFAKKDPEAVIATDALKFQVRRASEAPSPDAAC